MDTNKKCFLLLILFFLFIAFNVSGQQLSVSGRVQTQNTHIPVKYASVILSKQDSIFLKGTTTDSIGIFGLNNLSADSYILTVSCMGFEQKKILIQNLSESTHIDIFLNESVLSINEVVISASSTVSRINQRIVFPTQLQLSHSANGIQLLNTMMLPGLNINPMLNCISSPDGGTVILQINGINATSEELLTIQPGQIKRVEYSDYAGIRYGNSSKIVNFIVQRNNKGGVVGVDLMNSMNIIAGGDVVFAKFNQGESEYSLHYTAAFQDFKNNCRNLTERFDFGSSFLSRKEIREGGDYQAQAHDLVLGYNFQQNDSSFFNAKIKYGYTYHPHNDFNNCLVVNNISAGWISEKLSRKLYAPTVDLYYQYGFNNKQKLYANIVGSYFKAQSDRAYLEYNNTNILFRENLNTSSDRISLIAEGIYEKGFNRGTLKFGLKHIQSYTEQRFFQESQIQYVLNQSETALFSEWNFQSKQLNYSLGLKLNRVSLSNEAVAKDYIHLLPKAMIGYKFTENSFIRYDMEMSQTNPTLFELTDTEIRIDPYYVEKGNSSLKPYWNLNNALFYENRMGLLTFNLNLSYHYKHNPIMESKSLVGSYFVMTLNNMNRWNKYHTDMTCKIGMIRNVLQFSLTGGFNHYDSQGKDYTHSHSNFYYRADLLAMYKKWMFMAQIQPFDEQLYGETLTKSGNYHYLAVQYNTNNLSLGIGAFNPFKNVSRTIVENVNQEAPFRRESFSDASRIFVFTLTWNFSFGKTHTSGNQLLNNKDTEKGIRERYK
jgi:hypothetical protein